MLVVCIAMLVFGFLYSQSNLQLCNTLHKNAPGPVDNYVDKSCDAYHKNTFPTRPKNRLICQSPMVDFQYKESEKLSQKKGVTNDDLLNKCK